MKSVAFVFLFCLLAQNGSSQEKFFKNNYLSKFLDAVFDYTMKIEAGQLDYQTEDGQQESIHILPFYAFNREICNIDYQDFINWVQDSSLHMFFGHTLEYPGGRIGVDWEQYLDYNDLNAEAQAFLADRSKLVYSMQIDGVDSLVSIYPDTSFWHKSPRYRKYQHYLTDPTYAYHPVVGVSVEQALAYCHWLKGSLANYGIYTEVSLPTAEQWAYLVAVDSYSPRTPINSSKIIALSPTLFDPSDPIVNGPGSPPLFLDWTYFSKPNKTRLYRLMDSAAEWIITDNADESVAKTGVFNPQSGKPQINTYRYSSRKISSPLVGFRVCFQ